MNALITRVAPLAFIVLCTTLFFFSAGSIAAGLFFIGGLVGFILLYVDEKFFSDMYTDQGVHGNILMTRSVLFVLALVPLGIFVTTSAASAIGSGLVISVFVSLLSEMFLLRTFTLEFNARFLSQLKKPFTQIQIYQYIAFLVCVLVFLLFTVFVV